MAAVKAMVSSTKIRISQLAVDLAAPETVESPEPISAGTSVPVTTPCDPDDLNIFCGEPIKDDTETDPVASETVESRALPSGGAPVPVATTSDSGNS